MKKIILGISAFILGCIIVMAGIPAERAAAYGGEAGKVTINGVTTGDKLKGCKIITITYKSGDSSVNYEWASDAVKNAVAAKNNNEELTVKAFQEKTAAEQQRLLSGIPKALGSANVDLAEQTAANGTVSWTNVQLGGYLIVPTETKDVYEPMMAVVQPVKKDNDYVTQEATVTAKKNPAEVTKTVDREDIGEGIFVTYTIISDVPVYGKDAVDKYYGISDKISDGLTIDESTITLYAYTSRADAESDGALTKGMELGSLAGPNSSNTGLYTKCADNRLDSQTDEQSFAIEFDYDKIPAGIKAVKIVYRASLNENAVVGGTGNINTVEMEYSHYPYIENNHDRSKTTNKETVYTYKLKIVKVKKGDEDTKLAGAEFDLYRKVNDGENYDQSVEKVTKQEVSALPENGTFIKIGAVGPTDANGEAAIEKLALGNYCLVETKAPAGYGLLADGLEFTLAKGGDNDGTYTQQVENAEGFNLPQTGGTGTTIFTIAGIVLMAGAVVLFFIVRKKGTSDNKNR